MMLHREFLCKFEADGVTNSGTFKGYGAVFDNVDDYGDRILKGAFAGSIAEAARSNRLIPLLWQHKRDEPIGKWTKIEEDDRGLAMEGKLFIDFDEVAKRAAGHIQEGGVGGLSIGYRPLKTNFREEEGEDPVWELAELDLREVSVVTMPANIEARIEEIKSIVAAGGMPTPRELEMILREACHFSRKTAASIAHHAKPILRKRDAGENNGIPSTRDFLGELRKAAIAAETE